LVLVLLSPSVGLSKVLVVTIADSGADTQIAFVKMVYDLRIQKDMIFFV